MSHAKQARQKDVKYFDSIPLERPQPHSLEAERAVLAAMLREPEFIIDIAVEQLGNMHFILTNIVNYLNLYSSFMIIQNKLLTLSLL